VNEFITLLMAQQSGGATPPPSCTEMALPFVLLSVIFYFLLIRPQQKRDQAHRDMVSRLKKGSTVITSGGLIGLIHTVKSEEREFIVELTDKVRVRVAQEDVELYEVASPKADSKESK
jgi:preprotein translocase subunit YajC